MYDAGVNQTANPAERTILIAALDTSAAVIPADQRQELLKAFGKQMPALTALIRQEHRRASRAGP